MSDNKTETKQEAKVLDWDIATAHLQSVYDTMAKEAGQNGKNPFLWWAQHGTPLAQECKIKALRNQALYDKIMALKPGDCSTPEQESGPALLKGEGILKTSPLVTNPVVLGKPSN